MRACKKYRHKTLRFLIVLLVIGIIIRNGIPGNCEAQTDATSSSRSEEIEQILQEADASFQRQEFIASYELYRRVLSLDSANQHVRERIYEIARIYKALEEVARQDQLEDQAELFYQQYRSIVRYLLKVLTQQLNVELQEYSRLNLEKETGADIKNEIVSVLQNLVNILRELKTIYKQFPREESETEQMTKRIDGAIKKYEGELDLYQKE